MKHIRKTILYAVILFGIMAIMLGLILRNPEWFQIAFFLALAAGMGYGVGYNDGKKD